MAEKIIKVGIIGYGYSAKTFHIPLIKHTKGMVINSIFSNNLSKNKELSQAIATDFSEKWENSLAVTGDLTQFLSQDLDLIVITSINSMHFSHAKICLEHGKNVLLEKPACANFAEFQQLLDLAQAKKIFLGVFHNRRFDAGYLNLKYCLQQKMLGEVVDFSLNFDRFALAKNVKEWKEDGSVASGLLYDLGSHLIDQALHLFGYPKALYCDLDRQHDGVLSDDYFSLILYYGAFKVRLKASKYAKIADPCYVAHGKNGSFIHQHTDLQEDFLKQNKALKFSHQQLENDALVVTSDNRKIVLNPVSRKVENETYNEFYHKLYQTLTAQNIDLAKFFITPEEILWQLKIIEAAQKSDKLGQKIIF